jgi:hypothetical protein
MTARKVTIEDIKLEPDHAFLGSDTEDLVSEELFDTSIPEESPEQRPKYTTAREDTSDLVAVAWAGLGTLAIKTGRAPVGGKVMRLQSPAAGKQIDDVIRGTIVDRMLQPLVRSKSAMESFGAIIAAPILAEMIRRDPRKIVALGDPLMALIAESLNTIAPMLIAEKQKTREQISNYAAISEAFDIPKTDEQGNPVDPMRALFDYIFDVGPEEDMVSEDE